MAVLSVVIPIHNEEPSILPLYDRLTAVLEKLRRPYEIIFVDDGSSDATPSLLASFHESDSHIRVIRFSRNFGHQAALQAGMDESRGDALVCILGRR